MANGMRRRRAIIYSDNVKAANALKDQFTLRGYDTETCHEPANCPPYGSGGACTEPFPCADIVIADFQLPAMSGLEFLRAQSLLGCRISAGSRALLSRDFDDGALRDVGELGCMYLPKLFTFSEIAAWLDRREPFMILSLPLGMRRSGTRTDCREEVECFLNTDADPVKGIALNRGPAGMCLKIAYRVNIGQAIMLRSGPSPAPRTALVRWVVADEDGCSLVGLQYG